VTDSSTIVAPASGHGPSPRAVVRLSGPGLGSILEQVLDPPPRGRGAFRSSLALPPAGPGGPTPLRLPLLVLHYPPPRSYTGEHAAELLLPGNPHLIERLIARLTACPGVRPATPGEFSARAYLNGRLPIDRAEGVAAIIAAWTADDLAAARDLLAGHTGRRYSTWAEEVATLLALVESGIDFTDQEDVVPIAPAALAGRARALLASIESALGTRAGSEQPDARPTVVLAGRPNAGKSTLFNALLRRRRAVASPVAGTTRDRLAEPLDLSADVPGGPVVTLVDLAGLDAGAHGPIDAAAHAAAVDAIRRADAVVHCDPAGRFSEPLPDPVPPRSRPVIRVRTMADLPVPASPSAGAAAQDSMPVCALDGWNLGPLRRAIADAAWSRTGGGVASLLPRHRRALVQAASRLADAISLTEPDASAGRLRSPELVAGALREALDALGELVGRIAPDDVIGRIFATFCVGK
jgi:tRNA modification GTPase